MVLGEMPGRFQKLASLARRVAAGRVEGAKDSRREAGGFGDRLGI